MAELYRKAKEQKAKAAAARKAKQQEWAKANPELARKLDLFFSGKLPPLNFEEVAHKPDIATRAASGAVLGWLARKVENLIVASADLSNSDKTDGFLKQTKQFTKGDFSGAFLQAGVSELTMAGALQRHGAARRGLARVRHVLRLQRLHEAGGSPLGVDGAAREVHLDPRRLPGRRGRAHASAGGTGSANPPAGTPQEPQGTDEPPGAASRRCRRNLRRLEDGAGEHQDAHGLDLLASEHQRRSGEGGVNPLPGCVAGGKGRLCCARLQWNVPDVVLVASGSEVSTLIGGAELLTAKNGLKVRVVSVISEGLFRQQTPEYQASVLPAHLPTFGLTAGLAGNAGGPRRGQGQDLGPRPLRILRPGQGARRKAGLHPSQCLQPGREIPG